MNLQKPIKASIMLTDLRGIDCKECVLLFNLFPNEGVSLVYSTADCLLALQSEVFVLNE